ncbi:MAG TPA: zinc-ribbon domain-containing protein [Candidatus Saccharimonadales bacterium]|nr:zinc-ribbon domain-containing protein [Candidatus Saccharimonadales bacterium]
MANIDRQVTCPNCGWKFAVPESDIEPGASVACTRCAFLITFEGDAGRHRQTHPGRGDTVDKGSINVGMKPKK